MPGLVSYDTFGRFDGSGGEVAPLGIAVVGERPYAEGRGDNGTLALSDSELTVLQRMLENVEELVVVLVTGRPLVLGPEFDDVDALLVAWLPGSEGSGVVDVLLGNSEASGRLPYTWPSSPDSLGVPRDDRCDGARYPYGYGLDASGELLAGVEGCEEGS